MALQFILGAPGTGKTSFCLHEIETHFESDAPLYYLVPEQFSLQSERMILTQRAATVRVQVLSFNRLAYRLFSALGGPPGRVADELAKVMLLRKVLLDNAESLTYYQSAQNKQGFVDALALTLTELNHYCISADDLRARAETTPEGEGAILSAKLTDLALLCEKYREVVSGRFLLTDDMLALLVQQLNEFQGRLPLLDGALIYVDGFSGFTPQERQVLVQIMRRAKYMGITLTTRDTSTITDPLCEAPRFTFERLTADAMKVNVPIIPSLYLTQNKRHAHNPALAFFTQFYSPTPHASHKSLATVQTPHENNAVSFIPAADPYGAVLAVATQILTWHQQENYRFRDMAILCGDRSRYEKILRTVFDRLHIPIFIDTEINILSHPLTELIRAVLDMVNFNYNYESVFRFLKTGLTNIARNDIDILENYVLAHGINGYRWNYEMANPIAEAARKQLLTAMKPFPKTGKKDSVLHFCRKMYDLLYALNVPETLSQLFDHAIATGNPETARMHKQIWPKIAEVFDKLVEILGDVTITTQEFAALLDAGLVHIGLGRIPPTLDQVMLGDAIRSRYPTIKAMLVLGANEGVLPASPTTSGLFTDDEREKLRNTALELAPDLLARVNEQHYAMYSAFCQPTDKLVFVYALSETNGTPLRPSPVLRYIKSLFPTITPTEIIPVQDYFSDKTSPAGTLPINLSHNPYGAVLHTAASRLEAYARCPFAYYLTYMLKAKSRKYYEVLPTDVGILFHDVVALYAQEKLWLPRSYDEIGEIVTHLITQITPEEMAFHATPRNRHMLEKARRACTASIWALTKQMQANDYTPTYAEIDLPPSVPIVLENGKKLSLTGRIDRVDLHEAPDGNTYVKVIDYKSGLARFSAEEVQNGTQLQLMLYMNAMLKSSDIKNAQPGGIYYFPISDPLIKTDILLEEPLREMALLKQFKSSGIANDEKNAARFAYLRNAADEKIKQLATQLTEGNITPAPSLSAGRNACEFCAYTAICKRDITNV